MGRRVTIPVRIQQPVEHRRAGSKAITSVPQEAHEEPGSIHLVDKALEEERQDAWVPEPTQDSATDETGGRDEAEEWRERALRLQAEMDNYRRRQRRLAQDQIVAERERLLSAFLGVVDDLERALAAEALADDDEGLRQGIQLTHRTMLEMLRKEGVQQFEAQNEPFDPTWHDAIATVGRNGTDVAPSTVIEVLEPGYRISDRLLRPARVVVAV